jgi:hypothetical protein
MCITFVRPFITSPMLLPPLHHYLSSLSVSSLTIAHYSTQGTCSISLRFPQFPSSTSVILLLINEISYVISSAIFPPTSPHSYIPQCTMLCKATNLSILLLSYIISSYHQPSLFPSLAIILIALCWCLRSSFIASFLHVSSFTITIRSPSSHHITLTNDTITLTLSSCYITDQWPIPSYFIIIILTDDMAKSISVYVLTHDSLFMDPPLICHIVI